MAAAGHFVFWKAAILIYQAFGRFMALARTVSSMPRFATGSLAVRYILVPGRPAQ